MTDIEYSSGPDKVPLHFYISQNSTTHNNYQRVFEREKPKCPCRKYYHGDDCTNYQYYKTSTEGKSQGLLYDLLKNAQKKEVKTGYSNNKNPYVVYDKNIDENDKFRDDFHWLTTYNDKYRNPTYKNKQSNINTVEEDGYTRGIKYIWDPSLHKKEDNITITQKDYGPKKINSTLYPSDKVFEMNSGYNSNSFKVHSYKDLANYQGDGYNDIDRDKKIDWIYNRNVFPSFIEDDGFTRIGAVKKNLDIAPKFEEVKKSDYINLPDVKKTEQKLFQPFKTITQSDYTFSPMNVYERLKMNVTKNRKINEGIYSESYTPIKSDPQDFISETMDKFRDNNESKKTKEQLKNPIKCDYMNEDGYTKGNRNSKNFIEYKENNQCSKDGSTSNICECRFQSRLYRRRHNMDRYLSADNLPINPQNVEPDRKLYDYLKMTKNNSKQ